MPIPHNLKKQIDELFIPQVRLNVTDLIDATSQLDSPQTIEGFFSLIPNESFPTTYSKNVCVDLATKKWEDYWNIKEQEHNHHKSLPRSGDHQ